VDYTCRVTDVDGVPEILDPTPYGR
jgi:hypothetical protein